MKPDLWQAPEPMPQLRILPRPTRARARPRRSLQRQQQQPIALVDLLPAPDLDVQLSAIAREFRRPGL